MTTNDKAVISAIDDEHETRWYVVNTYAGHENRVKENLEKRVETMGIQDSLFRIVVAEETETVIGKDGKPKDVKTNVFPDEMEAILRRIGQSDKKISIDFEIGDTVKILAGPFSGMEGRVASLNDQTQTANVLIMLFGRETPTDINYGDLEKVELF